MIALFWDPQDVGEAIFLEDDLGADIGLIAGVTFGMMYITGILGMFNSGTSG